MSIHRRGGRAAARRRPLLHWVVGERKDWWDALPVVDIDDLSAGTEDRVPDSVRATLGRLLSGLADPRVVHEVSRLWWSVRVEKVRELSRVATTEPR